MESMKSMIPGLIENCMRIYGTGKVFGENVNDIGFIRIHVDLEDWDT